MQFNRSSPDEIAPLPKPSIDTGAGLERIRQSKNGCRYRSLKPMYCAARSHKSKNLRHCLNPA